MHPIIYTNPFGTLGRWSGLLDGLAEDRFDRGWVPAVDFEDHGDHYLVAADLPGIKPEDVNISLDGGILRVEGERADTGEDRNGDAKRYRRVERAFGAFKRSFRLPADVDPEAVEAHGEHGVLRIRLGKHAATQPRRIAVQTH